jgi:phenylpyruvate tautomerase PptA (4-oxalocrotonate tautomerase family)
VPYLQLDVSLSYPPELKQKLAERFGRIYSEHMKASVRRISVTVRELPGGVWRCTEDAPYPAALLMCDIRRGRPPEQRAGLAEALVEACVETLGLKVEQINVEFTQHSGDEMYHPLLGGLSDDWSAAEAKQGT